VVHCIKQVQPAICYFELISNVIFKSVHGPLGEDEFSTIYIL